MKFSIHYHPQVEAQLEEIVDWYEAYRKGLGDEFLDELESAISYIVKYPNGFGQKMKKSRQVRLNRFPYILIYEVHGNSIELYNVIHAKRHPIRRIVKK